MKYINNYYNNNYYKNRKRPSTVDRGFCYFIAGVRSSAATHLSRAREARRDWLQQLRLMNNR